MGRWKPTIGRDLYNGGVDSIGNLGKYLVVSGDLDGGSCADSGQAEYDACGDEVSVHCESGVRYLCRKLCLCQEVQRRAYWKIEYHGEGRRLPLY